MHTCFTRLRAVRGGLPALLALRCTVAAAWAAPDAAWRCPAHAYRLALPDTVGATAEPPGARTFFVDLADLGTALGGVVDTAGLRVVAHKSGAATGFSLDYRYGDRERDPDEYVRPVTGYVGEKSALAEGKLRRLGFLSLEVVPGERRYDLYFNLAGRGATLADRPDPAVRPWWVETVTDPAGVTDLNQDGRPDLFVLNEKDAAGQLVLAPRPGDGPRTCPKLTRPGGGRLISAPGLVKHDPRVAGRRVVMYHQVYSDQGLNGQRFCLSLPNAYRESGFAALYNFGEIPAGQWYEMSVEGRIRVPLQSAEYWLYHTYDAPCYVGETHVQFPPERAGGNRIGVETDVAQPGDDVTLTWQSAANPYLYPLRLTAEHRDGRRWEVAGQRVESWAEGFALAATVTSPAGRVVATLTGEAALGESWARPVRLGRLAPGRYRLRFEVHSRRPEPESVARLETDLRVLAGPFDVR